jgi:hypothetical protein
MLLFAGTAGAATYYVDNQNPSATDAGPGTQATPYIESADDPSAMDLWALVSGNVWLASNVTVDPKQVSVGGASPASSANAPAPIPTRSFEWDSGEGF